MSTIDWAVFLLFIAYVVWDGMRRTVGTKTLCKGVHTIQLGVKSDWALAAGE